MVMKKQSGVGMVVYLLIVLLSQLLNFLVSSANYFVIDFRAEDSFVGNIRKSFA